MRDVSHQYIIEKLAKKLGEISIPPSWAEFVKTGHGKQRPPVRGDWWQIRSASILMSIDKLGPVGVSKLTVKYGTKKNRGFRPEKTTKGSGSVIRKILQQLETAKLVEQTVKGAHKGRVLTNAGNKMIIESIKEAKKDMPKVNVQKAVSSEPKKVNEKAKTEKKPEAKSKEEKPVEKKAEKKTSEKPTDVKGN